MRSNNYIEFRDIDEDLKVFRVSDGKIQQLEKDEINAIRNIITNYNIRPISERNGSIIYEDLCVSYKIDYEKYLELFHDNSTDISDNSLKIPVKYKVNREKSRSIISNNCDEYLYSNGKKL